MRLSRYREVFVKQLRSFALLLVVVQCFLAASTCAQDLQPPRAKKLPRELTSHGHVRTDEYFWLNERDNPEVTIYLNAENEYTRAVMADVAELEEKLFDEIVGHIKQDDSSVPYEDRGFVYYTRFEEGSQYPILCRRVAGEENAREQVILDVNELAEGKSYCNVAGAEVSPDNRLLAFAVDYVGRRQYTLVFKDLEAGAMLPDEIRDVNGSVEWANDSQTVFYTQNDPQTLRSYLVKRHKLGSPTGEDPVAFEEQDEEFNCFLYKSRSREYILVVSSQTLSTEVRMLSADDPDSEFRVFLPREENHEYSIDHLGDQFYIRSNLDAPNFRLFTAPSVNPERAAWKEIIPHREETLLEAFDLFDDFVVLTERSNAQTQLRIVARDGSVDYNLPFEEPAFVVSASPVPDPSTDWLRYEYTSLTTPDSTYEFNMRTRERHLLKEEPVLGGFDREDYRTERVWATAGDGTDIPVSLVWHRTTPIDGTAPCLEYAYGSYGYSTDPSFQVALLPLLDRGFVFAIAHVRGGQEMGRQWYETGKLLQKKNTFTDFIDAGRFLIENHYADPKRLYARGGSAGGLLMGAVVNLAPELYDGVIADVPFVDVVTTMLDDTIPLTTFEYDEWGNPNEQEFHDYMLSYSPYDNVVDRAYPNLLVTTGLHDSQVQYWEPAKWVARLRDHWKGENLLLLKTNMEAGHGGASGRFDQYHETAFRYAFLLKLAGLSASDGRSGD